MAECAFGTTNSLISVIRNGSHTTFFEDDGLPIPSVVSYEGDKIVVGVEAKKQLSEVGMGVHGDVVKSPKTYLGREALTVGGVQRKPFLFIGDAIFQAPIFTARFANFKVHAPRV